MDMDYDLKPHAGWYGIFTRAQAVGAFPNGARVMKMRTAEGDAHMIGDEATVLGSIGHPTHGIVYFVEWDDMKRVAVSVVASKVVRVKPELDTGPPVPGSPPPE